jgi:hypothetical protein
LFISSATSPITRNANDGANRDDPQAGVRRPRLGAALVQLLVDKSDLLRVADSPHLQTRRKRFA